MLSPNLGDSCLCIHIHGEGVVEVWSAAPVPFGLGGEQWPARHLQEPFAKGYGIYSDGPGVEDQFL